MILIGVPKRPDLPTPWGAASEVHPSEGEPSVDQADQGWRLMQWGCGSQRQANLYLMSPTLSDSPMAGYT